MDSPHPAPGRQPAPGRPSARAGWHYRDARGRACGPYDDDALERLYRFGHVRAATPVWTSGDEDAAAPLRERPDRFRLHGDGRLEVLQRAAPVPPAGASQAVPDATPVLPETHASGAPCAGAPDGSVPEKAPGAAPFPVETPPPGESPESPAPGAHPSADAAADVPTATSSPGSTRAVPGPSKRPAPRRLAIAALLVTAAAALALLVRLAS